MVLEEMYLRSGLRLKLIEESIESICYLNRNQGSSASAD